MATGYARYNEDNIHNDPKKWGLTFLVEQDIAGEWEFDIFATWYSDEKKGLYYAIDSGCSCPTPFSEYTKLEDLMYADTKEEVLAAIYGWNKDHYDGPKDISAFRRKIRRFFDEK